MPQTRSPIVERLKTVLRAQYDAIVTEPLPERWVDLIKRLNEQERAQREDVRKQGVVASVKGPTVAPS